MAENKQDNIIDIDDLLLIWRAFIRNWYLFILLPGLGAVAAYFYTHRLTDVYQVKSQILLKSAETYDYQGQMFQGLGYYESYQDITNQKRVISSYDLIEETLQKLDFEVSYFIVGRIKTTEVYGSMPFDVEVVRLDGSFYATNFELKILNENEYQLNYLVNDEVTSQKGFFNEKITSPYYYFIINKNSGINAASLKSIQEINYEFRANSMASLVGK